MSSTAPARVIGRYAIFDEIASGGMASVHLGRLLGSVGFSKTVAIKCLHPHLARDPEFVKMFLDEARVAARIRHPNVVPTLDVVNTEGELFLVMEYVQGESLSHLVRVIHERGQRIPVPIAGSIVVGVLHGLHAAHEATNDKGEKLEIVHRDVSPQNVLVGRDGVAHILDFGVAKASGRLQTTREGQIKGKVAYMPPEQIRGAPAARSTDIYAASVVLWELLVGERLFPGENDANVLERVLFREVQRPSKRGVTLPTMLDEVVMRGLLRDPAARFPTARDMARAIEAATPVATAPEVGEWLEELVGDALSERQRKITEIESTSDVHLSAYGHGAENGSGADATEEVPQSGSRFIPESGRRPPPNSPVESGAAADIQAARPARRGITVAVVCLVALGAMGSILAFARHRLPEPPPAATAEATSAPPPTASAAPASTPSATAEASTTAPASSAPVAAVKGSPKSHPGPRPPAAAPATGKVVRDTPPAGTAGAKPVKPGCNPPFVVDDQGVKQYKLECL